MSVHDDIVGVCKAARAAARVVAGASTDTKNRCLKDAAARLRAERSRLLEANVGDVRRGRDAGLSAALLDRLTLTDARIEAMAKGLEEVAQLPDPVGECADHRIRAVCIGRQEAAAMRCADFEAGEPVLDTLEDQVR